MELHQYWKVIRKSLWIIILICLVGLAATAGYTFTQPPEYSSSATLLLNPSVPSALVPYVQTQVAANIADSYTKVIHTRSFANSVAKERGVVSIDMTRVTTSLVPNTLFYGITSRAATPEQAQQFLQAVLKVFLSSDNQQIANQSKDAAKTQMQQDLENELMFFDGQISDYNNQIKELEKQPSSTTRNDQLQQLRGQLVTLHQTKTGTMVALNQAGAAGGGANTALVIDQPSEGTPVPSNLIRNLVLALFVSLLLGVGVAFLRDYLDYTIQSPEYLETELHLTPIAVIGVADERSTRYGYGVHKRKGASGGMHTPASELTERPLVTIERPRSPESEAFRVMRTNIQFSSVDKPVHTLVVTSSGPGEGKSFTSSNLAVVMAQAGKRVILVDADLRKPTVHKVFNLPNNTGFTNLVLNGSTEVDGVFQKVPGVEGLAVITSGPMPPNPSELLNSQQAAEMMRLLAQQADVVIYDSPPAAAVTDAIILATRTDATILVIRAGSTRRDVVARVRSQLQQVGVANVMPVLNRVQSRNLKGYYYYSYYGAQPGDSSNSDGRKNGKGGKKGKGDVLQDRDAAVIAIPSGRE